MPADTSTPISTPDPTPTPIQTGPLNLVLKGKASVTSYVTGNTASKAIDGDLATYWLAAAGKTANQRLKLDFGESTTFNQVVVKEPVNMQRITSYVLQTSDDNMTFTDIPGTSGTTVGEEKVITFSNVTSRYLRIDIITAVDSPAVSEFEVYFTGTVVSPTATPTPTAQTFKISGYIAPDFVYDSSVSDQVQAGFIIAVKGTAAQAVTTKNGYFELTGLIQNENGYTLQISKPNYLHRELQNVKTVSDVMIGSEQSPLALWAGDMIIDGICDNAINMTDIMEILKTYNTTPLDPSFNPQSDLNLDGAVNMTDIMIVINHFNKTPSDYPIAF
ncbi:MAG: discoidin domain-containing protein [Clostridia bacterium]|nr:discoidin domain-containing protein [Clostridia bacterium]